MGPCSRALKRGVAESGTPAEVLGPVGSTSAVILEAVRRMVSSCWSSAGSRSLVVRLGATSLDFVSSSSSAGLETGG